MNRPYFTLIASLLLVALAPQATLADEVAAERARLATQRIQMEEERRAREEAERRALEEAERLAREEAERRSQVARERADAVNEGDASEEPADRIEMSRALEQLRELGALRDAGYVTEEEFERLKTKIIDGAM